MSDTRSNMSRQICSQEAEILPNSTTRANLIMPGVIKKQNVTWIRLLRDLLVIIGLLSLALDTG